MAYYDKKRGSSEIQGRLHEDAAIKKIGGDVTNLNDVTGNDKFRTYDLVSSEGVYSVKSHISESGELKSWVKNAYMRDFDKLIGWGTEVNSVELDAQALNQLPENVPLPADFRDKSPEEQVEYLKNNSNLCIPEDYVQPMREHLREKAMENPKTYLLPEDYTEEQMTTLTQRFQGTGLTSAETISELKEMELELTANDDLEQTADQALDEEEDKDYYNDYTF